MNPFEQLCYRDPRNPMFKDIYGDEETPPTPRVDCACDNCFYGKDALALEIIRMQHQQTETCTWVLLVRENENDYMATHDELWKPCDMSEWFRSGRVDDFEFCPYCRRKMKRDYSQKE